MMDIFQDSLDMVYINKKSSLEIMKIVRESITLGIMQRLDSEKVANLFMVEGVDIFIDWVASQLHLLEIENYL